MKWRKKPVVIEAYRFNGASSDIARIEAWMDGGPCPIEGGLKTNDVRPMDIVTLEGVMRAAPGDWIIKGVNGEFYPCKPDIFQATYERVDND